MISIEEAFKRLRHILRIKSRKRGRLGTRSTSFDPTYHNYAADRAIYRELVENDITTQERLKDYEAKQRKEKEDEANR